MTTQEAIEWLKRIKSKYIHGGDERFDEKRALAIDIAIEALQKQVPMKPKVSRGRSMQWYNCSACNGCLKGHEKYCDCGQCLDWSNEI